MFTLLLLSGSAHADTLRLVHGLFGNNPAVEITSSVSAYIQKPHAGMPSDLIDLMARANVRPKISMSAERWAFKDRISAVRTVVKSDLATTVTIALTSVDHAELETVRDEQKKITTTSVYLIASDAENLRELMEAAGVPVKDIKNGAGKFVDSVRTISGISCSVKNANCKISITQ